MNELLELLKSPAPGEMLTNWHATGKLATYLPEVELLFGVPQRPEHHPEVDTGVHVAMCLDVAHRLSASPAARFAVLLHDLGKGLTPEDELPQHVDHEKRGLEPVTALCHRLGVPENWRKLALLVCEYHLHAHRAFEMRSRSVIKLLNETGLEFDPVLLEDFVIACEADKRGRLGKTETDYPQGQYIREAVLALQGVPMAQGTPIIGRDTQERHRVRLSAVQNAGLSFRQAIEQAKTM
ncbi:MAG: HD domain-containing protein [Agitococcus sp.]|nr:HD domain-containing protein [Agitococcus sp.]